MAFQRDLPYNDLPLLPPGEELETRAVLKQTIASAGALADLRGTAAKVPNPRILKVGRELYYINHGLLRVPGDGK